MMWCVDQGFVVCVCLIIITALALCYTFKSTTIPYANECLTSERKYMHFGEFGLVFSSSSSSFFLSKFAVRRSHNALLFQQLTR